MDPEAFRAAHVEYRVRGFFRLAGALASVVIAFVLSLASLESYHDAIPVVIPIPFIASWLLGNAVAHVIRADRQRVSPIPRARVVRRKLAA